MRSSELRLPVLTSHLHFEMRDDPLPLNAMDWLTSRSGGGRSRGNQVTCNEILFDII